MIEFGLLFTIMNSIGLIIIFIILLYAKKKIEGAQKMMRDARDYWKNTKRDIEVEKREALVKLKADVYRKRKEFELELKRERLELDRLQSKLSMRYDNIEKKEQHFDELRQELQQKERGLLRSSDILRANETKLKNLYNELIAKLEQISNMSKNDAKQTLFDTLEAEVRLVNEKWVQKVEEEAKQLAKEKATSIIISTMQRYTADQVAPHSSGLVHLPNEEMKGRIIGKEGRNIKALEMTTGMEFIIRESRDITISVFNPIRREIARRSLEKLIMDGRINPTRIEETVMKCEKEIDEVIQECGK